MINTNGNGKHKEGIVWSTGTAQDTLQPHNIESEEALLGSILIEPSVLVECEEIGITRDDFFVHRHGWIYEAAQKLGRNCDTVSLCDELRRRGQLEEAGGEAYFSHLINATPTFIHAGHYARLIKRDSIRRNLIGAAGEIARLSFDNSEDDPGQIIHDASDILLKVSTANQSGQAQPVRVFCDKFVDNLDTYYSNEHTTAGLPTGLIDLDKIIGGLQAGKLILVAGRPAMGKSSLALQMAKTSIKERGSNVLYFSLEMMGEELVERLVSGETGIDSDMMRDKKLTPQNWAEINKAIADISDWSLTIDDRTRNIEAIRARAITHKYKYGLDLLVIDYAQRIQTNKSYNNRDSEIGAISAILKEMANDLQVPIVCVASLSRKCEDRHDKRPILSDLRESGNLEYDADIIVFVYRDDVYYPDSQFPNVAELIVSKNRGGKTGVVSAYFKKHLTTFVNLVLRVIGE